MTYRASDSSSRDCYAQPQSRLNQQTRCDTTDEGCPVIEESGSICGETNSLGVFQEFRQMYDDCLQKLEESKDGSATLRKLAPFKKLIDDLWEQNTMLVETVEELEQEATCTVTNLQEKLNNSCQKMCEYEEDIKSLTRVIQRYCDCGVFDTTGLKFNTVCPEVAFTGCQKSSQDAKNSQLRAKSENVVRTGSNLKSNNGESKKANRGPCGTTSKSKVPLTKNPSTSKTRISDYPDKQSFKKTYNESKCYYDNLKETSPKVDKVTDENYQDPKRLIKINFNLKNDSCVSTSDCCCSCSCDCDSHESDNC